MTTQKKMTKTWMFNNYFLDSSYDKLILNTAFEFSQWAILKIVVNTASYIFLMALKICFKEGSFTYGIEVLLLESLTDLVDVI